jgi:gliding motility-associated-like protein
MEGKTTLFRTFFIFLFGTILTPFWVFSQQPEQDCINAIPVCQNIYFQNNSYAGGGAMPNEINGNISCLLSGELNSVWYIFTVQTPGDVCFSITPNNPNDDYDWAVYDLTNNPCSDIFGNPNLEVSCNYSANVGCNGVTGPDGNTNPGTNPCFAQHEPCIPVGVGETYVVNVSNFSSSQSGYTLDFSASTATIFDNVPPEIDTVFADCGGNITVRFSENVVCSTVDPTDFQVTGPGGPYTVTAATGGNCVGGSFELEFDLTVNPPTTALGTYAVSLVDTVLDNCGNVGLYTTENLDIILPNIVAVASSDSVCQGDNVTLSTQSLPGFTYVWSGGAGTGATVTTTPTVSTLYTVTATDQVGCAFSGDVFVEVVPLPTGNFTAAPTAVCPDDPVTLTYTGSADPNANFNWSFSGATILGGNNGGPYQVFWPNSGLQTPSLIVEENGCVSNPFTTNITVYEIPTADFTATAEVCLGEAADFSYTGSATINAIYTWEFDGGNVVSGTGAGPYEVEWTTSGNKNICLTVEENGCVSQVFCEVVAVRQPPVVSIEPVENQCLKDNEFTFRSDGIPASTYSWDFGEPNATSTFPIPTYSYQSSGLKVVTLNITDGSGCEGSTTLALEIYPDVTADFTFDPACMGTPMQFTDASTFDPAGPVATWFWNFNNSQNASGPNPATVFDRFGFQAAKLVVTSEDGCKDSIQKDVTVYPLPEVSFTYLPTCALDETPFSSTSTITDIVANDFIDNLIWNFDDGTIVDGNAEITHTYDFGGIKNVTLTAISDKGCVDSVTVATEIYGIPDPPMVEDGFACEDESAVLEAATEEPGKRIEWFEEQNSEVPFFTGFAYTTPPLPYWLTYYVEAVSDKNCRSERVPIQAEKLPNTWGQLTASDTEVELPNGTVNFDMAGASRIDEIRWDFGDGGTSTEKNPTHNFLIPGRYEVTVDILNNFGCEAQFTQIIDVTGIREVHVPSAFTPNGDGINDFFTIGYNLVTSVQFTVYNRWGQEVFSSNNPDFRWDGRLPGGAAAPQGVYSYVLKGIDIANQPIQKVGTITLIR